MKPEIIHRIKNNNNPMNIRRLLLDVDKASTSPSLVELAAAIDNVDGVEALNISVTEIDMETMDLDITIEGNNLDYDSIVNAIEDAGAVVHSLDEIVVGSRILEHLESKR
ncbi:MAG TPA: DUF211 domain-containing protein [Bacteroidales bacterium]|jgi:hypothetical protein|nr:DUF211 domain-containing protein [Bacteroidales bacterium]